MAKQKVKESTALIFELNTTFLSILQAIDFSKFGGDYRDFNSFCQVMLKMTEKERSRLLKAGYSL